MQKHFHALNENIRLVCDTAYHANNLAAHAIGFDISKLVGLSDADVPVLVSMYERICSGLHEYIERGDVYCYGMLMKSGGKRKHGEQNRKKVLQLLAADAGEVEYTEEEEARRVAAVERRVHLGVDIDDSTAHKSPVLTLRRIQQVLRDSSFREWVRMDVEPKRTRRWREAWVRLMENAVLTAKANGATSVASVEEQCDRLYREHGDKSTEWMPTAEAIRLVTLHTINMQQRIDNKLRMLRDKVYKYVRGHYILRRHTAERWAMVMGVMRDIVKDVVSSFGVGIFVRPKRKKTAQSTMYNRRLAFIMFRQRHFINAYLKPRVPSEAEIAAAPHRNFADSYSINSVRVELVRAGRTECVVFNVAVDYSALHMRPGQRVPGLPGMEYMDKAALAALPPAERIARERDNETLQRCMSILNLHKRQHFVVLSYDTACKDVDGSVTHGTRKMRMHNVGRTWNGRSWMPVRADGGAAAGGAHNLAIETCVHIPLLLDAMGYVVGVHTEAAGQEQYKVMPASELFTVAVRSPVPFHTHAVPLRGKRRPAAARG